MAEQWLSIVEYARTFAVSDMTVRRRIKTGKLNAVLRDGKYYIPIGTSEGKSKSKSERIIEESPLTDFSELLALPTKRQPKPPEIPVGAPVAAFEAPQPPLGSSLQGVVFAGQATAEDYLSVDPQQARLGASVRTLPNQITHNLQRNDSTMVDSQALLQFCEQSMTRISSIERHLQDSFQQRLQNLETQIKLKDGVIGRLKQQVEDLQMLVKLMEQKPK